MRNSSSFGAAAHVFEAGGKTQSAQRRAKKRGEEEEEEAASMEDDGADDDSPLDFFFAFSFEARRRKYPFDLLPIKYPTLRQTHS